MAYDAYQSLSVSRSDGIATITIDHPPINLMGNEIIGDFMRLAPELAGDKDVRVAVFRSANPEFFIAHADVSLIQQLPAQDPEDVTEMSFFHSMVENYRTLPKVTIGVIEGCARGGGSEFLLSLDMRFGAIGRCVLGQPEVALGILPGGSGTQRLPRLMGRSRALEVVLGCDDFDAELAEHYGWINRALPPDEIGPFVDRLAKRIASFPAIAIERAKRSVLAADLGVEEGLVLEQRSFVELLASPEAQERMKIFLAAAGQTREKELQLGAHIDEMTQEIL